MVEVEYKLLQNFCRGNPDVYEEYRGQLPKNRRYSNGNMYIEIEDGREKAGMSVCQRVDGFELGLFYSLVRLGDCGQLQLKLYNVVAGDDYWHNTSLDNGDLDRLDPKGRIVRIMPVSDLKYWMSSLAGLPEKLF